MVVGQHKQSLQDAFSSARLGFFASCENGTSEDLMRFYEQAYTAAEQITRSGLFSAAAIYGLRETLDTISSITTAAREVTSEEKSFYDAMAKKVSAGTTNEFNG